MPDTDESAHSHHYRAVGDEIEVREPEEVEDEDGVFEIRMPIASTGDVRNEGDDPLTRGELEGFARQLSERSIGVFPAHGGDDMIAAGRYSPFERLGNWHSAEFQTRSEDGEDGVLMATARMPDPETLPAATKQYRTALAILKEQAMRGIDQDASIGWREDESFAGGNDLMEASIVGIGADWRTNTGDEAAEVVTQAALDAGANPNKLVENVKRAVGDDEWSAELRFFRVVAPEEREDEFDDPVLGVGVSFPESGVYVDWHTSAFPDELDHPHVSEYGSVSDLQKATGNDIVDMERPPGSRAVREAVRKGRPLGPEDDPQRFDDWDDCMSAMQESGHSEEEAKRICGSFKDDTEEQDADTSDTDTQDHDMTDTETDDEPTDEQDAADDAETQDGDTEQVRQSPAEIADMAEDIVMGHIERATDELREELEDMMGDGGENESDDGDDDDEEEDDEKMNTSDADEGDSEQSADDDDADALREEVQSLQDELQSIRENGLTAGDVDTPDPEDEQDADDTDESEAETDATQTADSPSNGLGDYR